MLVITGTESGNRKDIKRRIVRFPGNCHSFAGDTLERWVFNVESTDRANRENQGSNKTEPGRLIYSGCFETHIIDILRFRFSRPKVAQRNHGGDTSHYSADYRKCNVSPIVAGESNLGRAITASCGL